MRQNPCQHPAELCARYPPYRIDIFHLIAVSWYGKIVHGDSTVHGSSISSSCDRRIISSAALLRSGRDVRFRTQSHLKENLSIQPHNFLFKMIKSCRHEKFHFQNLLRQKAYLPNQSLSILLGKGDKCLLDQFPSLLHPDHLHVWGLVDRSAEGFQPPPKFTLQRHIHIHI